MYLSTLWPATTTRCVSPLSGDWARSNRVPSSSPERKADVPLPKSPRVSWILALAVLAPSEAPSRPETPTPPSPRREDAKSTRQTSAVPRTATDLSCRTRRCVLIFCFLLWCAGWYVKPFLWWRTGPASVSLKDKFLFRHEVESAVRSMCARDPLRSSRPFPRSVTHTGATVIDRSRSVCPVDNSPPKINVLGKS